MTVLNVISFNNQPVNFNANYTQRKYTSNGGLMVAHDLNIEADDITTSLFSKLRHKEFALFSFNTGNTDEYYFTGLNGNQFSFSTVP